MLVPDGVFAFIRNDDITHLITHFENDVTLENLADLTWGYENILFQSFVDIAIKSTSLAIYTNILNFLKVR